MAFFLAVDNGGTKCDYVLADETRELVRVRSGTLKRMRADAATASANLDAALTELTARTAIAMRSIARTCIGTAGEAVPLVTGWLREAFAARVSGELVLLGDVEIALDAAFQGGAGVLVLAGTGSNVAGRMSDGKLTSTGGWGPALADQGSGHRIGEQALRAIFLAQDEGRSTRLLEAVLGFWSLGTRDELVAFANQTPAPDFSALTALIVQCAEAGDEIAASVLQSEAEALAYLVRLLLRRMRSLDPVSPMPAVAFAGSIMENVLHVRNSLIAAVRDEFPAIQFLDGIVDPVLGALWRARKQDHLLLQGDSAAISLPDARLR
jgi:N-acetylglucosamine kinase-like BadF-type ATPase